MFLRKIKIGCGLLLVLLFICGIIHVFNMPIKRITISGDFHHTDRAKLQARLQPYIAAGMVRAPLAALRAVVLENVWVDHVEIHRIWPGALSVHVHERVGCARWLPSSVLDCTGELFVPNNTSELVGLPVIDAPESFAHDAFVFLQHMQAKLIHTPYVVKSIVWHHKLGWQLSMSNGAYVRFNGPLNDSQVAKVWSALYKGEASRGNRRLHYLDMRYEHGFVMTYFPE